MGVPLYMDVHVPFAIAEQLRRRGIDVLTSIEDGQSEALDSALLDRATDLGRLLFTHDVRFRAMAERWQRAGRPFGGLLFGAQLGGTIGQFVTDLELICRASTLDEWANVVEWLPFK